MLDDLYKKLDESIRESVITSVCDALRHLAEELETAQRLKGMRRQLAANARNAKSRGRRRGRPPKLVATA